MKLVTSFAGNQPWTELQQRVLAKWRKRTQSNTPAHLDAIESDEDILRDLIAMPTITGKYDAIHESLEYIHLFLASRGMHVIRHEWKGIEALIATTRPTKTPTVFLAGHIDVVPAPPELFNLEERDGKYYGRGVLDMKGAIAAYLSVIKDLPEPLDQYDFGVMIMTDEEVGGFDGAARLAEAGYLPKVLVLPDGANADFSIETFAKGIWHLTIEANGHSAHGSRPWEGVNAIDKLNRALAEIHTLFPNQNPESNTMNIGILEGGKAINQIPATATASLDMRLISVGEQRRIKTAITDILSKHDIKAVTEVEADPMVNDPEHPLLKAYGDCTAAVTGKPAEWVMSKAGNDGRFFASKGVVCAISYPTGGGHHGPEEWISKEGYVQMQQIIRDYLDRVAKNTGETIKALKTEA